MSSKNYSRHMRTHTRQLLNPKTIDKMKETRCVCVSHGTVKLASDGSKRIYEFTFAVCLACGMDVSCCFGSRGRSLVRHEYLQHVSAAHRCNEGPTLVEEFIEKHNKSCGHRFDEIVDWFDPTKKSKLPERPKTTKTTKTTKAPRKTLVAAKDPQVPPSVSVLDDTDRTIRDAIVSRFRSEFEYYGWDTDDEDSLPDGSDSEDEERREEAEEELELKRENRAKERSMTVLGMLDMLSKSNKKLLRQTRDAADMRRKAVSDVEMKAERERMEMENRMNLMERELERLRGCERRMLEMRELLNSREKNICNEENGTPA